MDLDTFIAQADQSRIFVQRQVLCQTLAGNNVPLVTITAMPTSNDKEALEELSQFVQFR